MSLFDVIKHPISSIHDDEIYKLPHDILYNWANQFLEDSGFSPDGSWDYDSGPGTFQAVILWTIEELAYTGRTYDSVASADAEKKALQLLRKLLGEYNESV